MGCVYFVMVILYLLIRNWGMVRISIIIRNGLLLIVVVVVVVVFFILVIIFFNCLEELLRLRCFGKVFLD